MGVRLASFVVWFAVAGSVLFWGLRLLARPLAAPAHALAVAPAAAGGGGDVTRLLGAALAPVAAAPAEVPVAAPADSRFRLVGVAAPRGVGGAAGLALIAVDGKPPRAFGLGATVDTALVVLGVQHRGVQLGPRGGPVQVRLELPPLPAAQRGQPGAAGPAVPGQVPVQPLAQPIAQPAAQPMVPPPTAVMPQPMSVAR